jgi:TonB family protein
MRGLQWAAVLVAGVSLSGCATIIEGTTENVSVSTAPEQGAQCTLKNSEGTWFVTTPGSTTVHKTKNDMTIDCTKAGFAPGHLVAASHFGGTTAGNVIAGGVIGIGVDAASGANYHYDSPVTVSLGAATPTANATPAPATSVAAATPAAMPTAPASAVVASNTKQATTASTPAAPVSVMMTPDAPLHLDHKYPNYQPAYPDAAQTNDEQGNVVLNVEIASSGKVRNIKIDQSSGFDDLDNAAIAGVLRWRFVPADDGTNWTKVTIAYRLPTVILVPPKDAPQAAR